MHDRTGRWRDGARAREEWLRRWAAEAHEPAGQTASTIHPQLIARAREERCLAWDRVDPDGPLTRCPTSFSSPHLEQFVGSVDLPLHRPTSNLASVCFFPPYGALGGGAAGGTSGAVLLLTSGHPGPQVEGPWWPRSYRTRRRARGWTSRNCSATTCGSPRWPGGCSAAPGAPSIRSRGRGSATPRMQSASGALADAFGGTRTRPRAGVPLHRPVAPRGRDAVLRDLPPVGAARRTARRVVAGVARDPPAPRLERWAVDLARGSTRSGSTDGGRARQRTRPLRRARAGGALAPADASLRRGRQPGARWRGAAAVRGPPRAPSVD
jgi:hypothetical protein